MKTKLLFSLLASMVASAGLVPAENWPQFRGPTAQGISTDKNPPLTWSATENVAWQTELPGESWSSPVVWGDRVFVTTATDGDESCRVLSLNRKAGTILWDEHSQ